MEPDSAPPEFRDLAFPIVFSVLLEVVVFTRWGLYHSKRTQRPLPYAWNITKAVLTVWAVTYVVTNFTREVAISRLMMAGLLVVWPPLALANRLIVKVIVSKLRERGWNVRTAAIVGAGRVGQTLYHAIKRNPWVGIEAKYFVGHESSPEKLFGLDVVRDARPIKELLYERPVDIVFVALPSKEKDRIEQVLSQLVTSTVDVRVVPDLLSYHFLRHDVSQLENLSIITLTKSPQHGLWSLLKRPFDIAASLFLLCVTAVPMLIIAAAIKLTSKGPVFYRQTRASLGGEKFSIIKFRTMVQDAEAASGPVWARKDDPRVTRVGRFLRRTSLDELPQLFNVLLGHMSLVGPRPERPELIEEFRKQIPRYMLRHHVKAGLTGWAQVNGLRGNTSLRKRLQYDLYYIMNWSFGLDLLIIAMTPFRGLISSNAY